MSFKNLITLSNITLIVALTLSTVAAYYSIYGLTAIFAGAVIPVIIMGSILEIGKITTTVWLKKYWHRCSWVLKSYLVPAVILLAFITSMGIFGFLSKAHMEHGVTSGEVQTKLSIIDEKVKTEKDNIEYARKALSQMDDQVNARLSRGESENGAERAVQIRRQQATERNKLLKEIQEAQKKIQVLNEERAPIAAENRKVEAEVGPIKYVAAFIYGDNPDSNLLERAVRWVIILLVIVFDPLAIALVLAANSSKQWDKEEPEESITEISVEPKIETQDKIPHETIDKYEDFVNENQVLDFAEEVAKENFSEIETNENNIKHTYLDKEWVHIPNIETNYKYAVSMEPLVQEKIHKETTVTNEQEIKTSGVTKEPAVKDLKDGYVLYDNKHFAKQALKELHPELFITVDSDNKINTNFGIQFPSIANVGDMFVRVDTLPNRVFKFDGKNWIEVNKVNTDSYLHDEEYIKYLIGKLETLEYDPELLSENEKTEIEAYLKKQNTQERK